MFSRKDYIGLVADKESHGDLYEYWDERTKASIIGLLAFEGKMDTLTEHVLRFPLFE